MIYDPSSATGANVRTPFPNNTIPSSRISTIAQSLQSYLPAPTNGNISNNYLATLPVLVNNNNTTEKVDYNISDRHRIFGLISVGKYATNFTGSLTPISTNSHVFNEAQNTFDLQNNVLWIKGKHNLTFGFQFQALEDNETFPQYASFTFSNNETAQFSSTGTLMSTTGLGYAGFLLGAVDSATAPQYKVTETGGRYKTYAFYAQDDFKVSSRLTLNLGLQ